MKFEQILLYISSKIAYNIYKRKHIICSVFISDTIAYVNSQMSQVFDSISGFGSENSWIISSFWHLRQINRTNSLCYVGDMWRRKRSEASLIFTRLLFSNIKSDKNATLETFAMTEKEV